MAKVSAHGSIIGTIERVNTATRYMSDGVVLKNKGFGWKIAGKVKAGIDPVQAFANAQKKHQEALSLLPAYAAYRKALHDLAGVNKRWKLHMAVSLMPDDCDGVWSEACDGYADNVCADIDEVAELCGLYQIAVAEAKNKKVELN